MPFTLPTKTVLADDDDAPGEGNVIFTGFVRYGELIPTCPGIVTVAAEVVAVLFFSPKVATVSRSLPPPETQNDPFNYFSMIGFIIEF